MNDFHDPGLLEPLTEREREILHLLAAGLSNHEIAQQLVLAPGTVKVHTRNLYGKLGANSRTQAIQRAGEWGYLDEAVEVHPPNHNLPAQATPFVGRERELNELSRLLYEPSLRLLTILGPGGMGKSRLALETAAMIAGVHGHTPRRVNLFPDGVYFVALAPLSSPDFMVSTIADALDSPFYGGTNPRQQIIDRLHSKSLLLVMDNFEHLLDGVSLVSDILAAAPGVKILATSRERLNLLEETIFRIEGIEFPKSESLTNIQEYSASRLFLQSAGRVLPGFDPQPDDVKYVARICRLVEGMPLGILLATAWIDALSLKEIADEIEHSLDFLATEMRNMPDHLRSIRAVFERSCNLLKDEEREVFRRLSVFRGGFTREAAQSVAGASLRDLTTLVNKSLVRRDQESRRYEVHELLRQYAEERLTEAERERVLDRHCEYFMDFLAQSEAAVRYGQQQEGLAAMDNIRAAWFRAVARPRVSSIRKAITSLEWIYEIQGWYQEAKSAFAMAANALRTDDLTGERGITFGVVLGSWGFFSVRLGEVETGHQLMREGLAILRSLDARLEIADCLMKMTDMPGAKEDYVEDKRYAQEAHDLFAELGVKWGIAHTLNTLGNVAIEHEKYIEAAQYYWQGLQLERQENNPRSIGWALMGLGEAAIGLGNYEEARQHLQEGLIQSQEIGYQIQVGTILARLGEAEFALGNVQDAQRYWRNALQIGLETRMPTVALLSLVGFSHLMVRENMDVRAVELLALAKHHPGGARAVGRQASHLLDALEAKLPINVFHETVERGQTLDLHAMATDLLEQYA